MTEDEAKSKWCKERALILAVEAITGNAEGESNCIASGCMMWVWDEGKIDTMGRLPSDASEPRVIKQGHCGLIK